METRKPKPSALPVRPSDFVGQCRQGVGIEPPPRSSPGMTRIGWCPSPDILSRHQRTKGTVSCVHTQNLRHERADNASCVSVPAKTVQAVEASLAPDRAKGILSLNMDSIGDLVQGRICVIKTVPWRRGSEEPAVADYEVPGCELRHCLAYACDGRACAKATGISAASNPLAQRFLRLVRLRLVRPSVEQITGLAAGELVQSFDAFHKIAERFSRPVSASSGRCRATSGRVDGHDRA